MVFQTKSLIHTGDCKCKKDSWDCNLDDEYEGKIRIGALNGALNAKNPDDKSGWKCPQDTKPEDEVEKCDFCLISDNGNWKNGDWECFNFKKKQLIKKLLEQILAKK